MPVLDLHGPDEEPETQREKKDLLSSHIWWVGEQDSNPGILRPDFVPFLICHDILRKAHYVANKQLSMRRWVHVFISPAP